jgi:formylmethanofuran dehydrogenase subunit E
MKGPGGLLDMRLVALLAAFVAPLSPALAVDCPLTVAEATAMPYAPAVKVVDTVSSLGPLAAQPQLVTLSDLVRYHGHPCDGLVVAASGIAYGLHRLFPEGVTDRTDLVVAVNRSACYGDVAAYLTGARHRYGSLVVDAALGDEWIVGRRSTGASVRVTLRAGFKPPELAAMERELRAAACPPALITAVQGLQRRFALAVLAAPPERVFEIQPLERFPYPSGEPRPDTLKRSCGGATTGRRAGGSPQPQQLSGKKP